MAIKINNRRTYTIDDYLRDRNQPAQNVANNNPLLMKYTQPQAQSLSGSRLDRVHTMAAIDAENKNAMYGPAAPNSSVELPRWMTDPPVTQLSGGTETGTNQNKQANIPGKNSIWAADNISSMDRVTDTGVMPSVGVKADASARYKPTEEPAENEGEGHTGGEPEGEGHTGGEPEGEGHTGGEPEGEGLTEGEVKSIIVTSDTKNKMNASMQKVIDMFQRGFKYNEKESPLYAILQKQMADEARLASGRAYSRAVANAGGFGSSYATLAAEEASRQVMEGWDEQQLSLYQAAKEEWESQFQSAVDEYTFLSTLYQQEKAEADEEKANADKLYASGLSFVRETFGTTYDEAAIKASLQGMGLTDEQISSILTIQKQYSEAMENSSMAGQSAIAALGDRYKDYEFNEDEMRLYLKGLNYSETAINEAITYWSQFSNAARSSKFTTEAAMEVLGEKYKEDEYDEAGMRDYLKTFTYFSDEVINEALAEWKKGYDAKYGGKKPEKIPDTVQEAVALLRDGFKGEYSPTAMEQYLKTLGVVGQDATDAIEQYRLLLKTAVSDYTPTSVSDAISNAGALKYNYEKGVLTVEEYDEAVEKNGAYIMKNVSLAMSDIDEVDYKALGIAEDEWNEMEDGEKKLEIFERAGQLAKDYIIAPNQFYKLIYTDLTSEFESPEYKDSDYAKKMTKWINSAKMIESFYENGYINQDYYIDFTYDVIEKEMEKAPGWKSFVSWVKKTMEIKEKDVTREEFDKTYSYQMYPYPAAALSNYSNYGSNKNEKEASKDLLFKMAKFMISHGWEEEAE